MDNDIFEADLPLDAELIELLQKTKDIPTTPEMLYNQKISLAYSCFNVQSGVTRSDVKNMIDMNLGKSNDFD